MTKSLPFGNIPILLKSLSEDFFDEIFLLIHKRDSGNTSIDRSSQNWVERYWFLAEKTAL
jgi:hypothetical protein